MSQNTCLYRHIYEEVKHLLRIYDGKGEKRVENRIKQDFLKIEISQMREDILCAVQKTEKSINID